MLSQQDERVAIPLGLPGAATLATMLVAAPSTTCFPEWEKEGQSCPRARNCPDHF